MIDRIPPHSLEAEMALLGAMLIDRALIDEVHDIVRVDDFYAHVHETICAAILELHAAHRPIDSIALAELLKRRDLLEKVGGHSYLSKLMESVQTVRSARYYAQLIADKAQLRRLILAGAQVTSSGYDGEEDVATAINEAEAAVFAVGERALRSTTPISDLIAATYADLTDRFENKQQNGIRLGFEEIDRYFGGLEGGTFVIVAARPSMGKTGWALNAIANAAAMAPPDETDTIAFFSLEMSRAQLMRRFVSSFAQIPSDKLKTGDIRPADWDRIGEELSNIGKLRIDIDDSPRLSVPELRSRCRRIKAQRGLRLVVVDYLGLLKPGARRGAYNNRNDEISEISADLKAVAKELDVPLIALSQLSREPDRRNDKRPMLADLRDSGSLEQDADIVAFLYRDAYYNREADAGLAEFIIAKQRDGPTGTVPLRFLSDLATFRSM